MLEREVISYSVAYKEPPKTEKECGTKGTSKCLGRA